MVVADGTRADGAVPAPLAVPSWQVPRTLDCEAIPRELIVMGFVAEDLPYLRARMRVDDDRIGWIAREEERGGAGGKGDTPL